jgi:hypothetical protein
MMIRSPAEILLLLEQECLAVDRAIAAREWPACDASARVQRKLTHELDIAMTALDPSSPEVALVRKRIDRLKQYRDGQIQRLRAFNQSIGKRLTTMGRFRTFAKQRALAERSSKLLDYTS